MKQQVRPPLSRELILRLQRTAGNRAVQRLIERLRAEAAEAVREPAPPPPPPPEPVWWRRFFAPLFGAKSERSAS